MNNARRTALRFATLGAMMVSLSGFAGWASVRVEWNWNLPKGFPVPNVPADNPMSAEKVELGRRLFYDKRLSLNEKFSCASCHQQSRAFADPLPRGVGSTGQVHPRGSMPLMNVAYSPALTWANPNMKTLEQQAVVPMFGETPVELGLAGKEDVLLERLAGDPRYATWFAAAFPDKSPSISLEHITKAIASFERTLISGNSAYDRVQNGDSAAMSASAKRGQELFFSEDMECFHCHGGFNFTGTVDYVGKGIPEVEFHNTALYNLDGKGAYPKSNPGLREFTNRAEDEGRFKAPSLRNVALTAPYMHDGSVPTLEGVLDHYAAGGRTIRSGPNKGVGSNNPNRSEFIRGFDLTPQGKRDLVAFLRALTDSAFISDRRFSNRWADTLVKTPDTRRSRTRPQ